MQKTLVAAALLSFSFSAQAEVKGDTTLCHSIQAKIDAYKGSKPAKETRLKEEDLKKAIELYKSFPTLSQSDIQDVKERLEKNHDVENATAKVTGICIVDKINLAKIIIASDAKGELEKSRFNALKTSLEAQNRLSVMSVLVDMSIFQDAVDNKIFKVDAAILTKFKTQKENVEAFRKDLVQTSAFKQLNELKPAEMDKKLTDPKFKADYSSAMLKEFNGAEKFDKDLQPIYASIK